MFLGTHELMLAICIPGVHISSFIVTRPVSLGLWWISILVLGLLCGATLLSNRGTQPIIWVLWSFDLI